MKRFLSVFVASALLAAVVYFGAALALAPAFVSAEYWVRELIVVKRHIAASLGPGRRLVVASGSSTLFGVDAELLSTMLGRPVLNLGLHASLTLRTILDEAAAACRDGDTLILHLEPPYFQQDGSVSAWQYRNQIAWEPERWKQLNLMERVTGLARLGPGFGVELLVARFQEGWHAAALEARARALDDAGILRRFANASAPTTFQYSAYHVGPYGDLRATSGTLYQGVPRSPSALRSVSATSREVLRGFVRAMRGKGVSVYLANVPYVRTAGVDLRAVQDADELFRAATRDIASTIDLRADLLFDRSLFFNTDLHLNDKGREIRTRRLADAIERNEGQLLTRGKPE